MIRILVVVLFSSLMGWAQMAEAQDEPRWKKQLTRTLVRSEGGRLIYEDRALCEITPRQDWPGQAQKLQIRSSGEAPSDGTISRDVFLTWITTLETQVLTALAGIGSYSCEVLDALIGVPDLEVIMRMTHEGYQVEVTETRKGERSRITRTWAEVYPER